MRTLRAMGYVLFAFVVLVLAAFFRPVGADEVVAPPLSKAEIHARCEASVQGNMHAIGKRLSDGLPAVAIMHEFAVFAMLSGMSDEYRDAILDIVPLMADEKSTIEAQEKAVLACVVDLSPEIQT